MNRPPPAAAPPPPPLSLPIQPTKSTSPPLPSHTPHSKSMPNTPNTPNPAACVHIPLPSSVKLPTNTLTGKNIGVVVKSCESCKKNHDGSYGSGRFCSSNCAKKVGANIKWSQVISGNNTNGNSRNGGGVSTTSASGAANNNNGDGGGGGRGGKVVGICRKRRKQDERKCENCSVGHDGSYGSGRFCSVHCARRVAASRKWEKQRGEKRRLAGLVKRRRMTPSPPPVNGGVGGSGSLKRSVSAPAGSFMPNGSEGVGVGLGGYVDYSRLAPYSPCAGNVGQHQDHGRRLAMQPTQPGFWAVPPPHYTFATPMVPASNSAGASQPPPVYYLVPANATPIAPGMQHHVPTNTAGHVANQMHHQFYAGPHPTQYQAMPDMRYPMPTPIDMSKMPMFGIPHGMVPVASDPAMSTQQSPDLSMKGSGENGSMASPTVTQNQSSKPSSSGGDNDLGDSTKIWLSNPDEVTANGKEDKDGKQKEKDSSSAAHVLLSLKARDAPVKPTPA